MTILPKQENPSKLGDKGRPVVLVGYGLNCKCHHVYDPKTSLIHSTGDITFEEDKFPLKLDKLGGGSCSSTPPSVRPDGDGFELDL